MTEPLLKLQQQEQNISVDEQSDKVVLYKWLLKTPREEYLNIDKIGNFKWCQSM